MTIPFLFADFTNADPQGRVRLNCTGTEEDLARLGVSLEDGLRVIIHDEEVEADAEVVYSVIERIWVARIDWNSLRSVTAGRT
jgi:hypothetical protein